MSEAPNDDGPRTKGTRIEGSGKSNPGPGESTTALKLPIGRRRYLGYMLAGAGFAYLGARDSRSGRRPEVHSWVADRGADRIYGLDRDLIVRLSIELRAPQRLVWREGGGVWVLSARHAAPLGCRRLIALSRDGSADAALSFSSTLDLASLDGREALVLEGEAGGAQILAWRVDEEGHFNLIASRDRMHRIAGCGGKVLLASEEGWLWLHSIVGGESHAERVLGEQILDVAPGPVAGSWWVLGLIESREQLWLLDEALQVSWSTRVGFACRELTPVPGRELVWLVNASAGEVCLLGRGRNPRQERERGRATHLATLGLGRGAASTEGELLLAAPGALFQLGEDGSMVAAQGGFHFLADVALCQTLGRGQG